MKDSFSSHNIVVVNRCCKDRGNELVKTDVKRLKQVLINVLKNSVEAIMDRGFILINCRILNYRDKKMLEVGVMDNGKGIKKEDLPFVFSPYFTTKVYGSGLGLTVTREILEQMGGSISIESKEEKGTTVKIFLPILEE